MTDLLAEDGQTLLTEDGQALILEEDGGGPAPTTPVGQAIFRARARRAVTRDGKEVYPRDFATLVKRVSEIIPVRLVFTETEMCCIYRQPNDLVEMGECCRPSIPNGFAYQCSRAGTTGFREPMYPFALDKKVMDGSVEWTAISADANGLNPIVAPAVALSQPGLTVSAIAVSETTCITAEYVGGVDGQDYEAVYSFTVNGKPRQATQLVQVRGA